ncbi:SpoIIAA family protein [Thermonema rossianum]|uniref:STAS/SEC14 domain-containing protein n=1 Tax=Thermonema rossianum TaxID=55505 RepID=UPI000571C960|nr:STAS/SEC14 domain-containing protein [Thermonema rossianum]
MQKETIGKLRVYQNDYIHFYFDEQLQSLVMEYSIDSDLLSDEEFKEAMEAYAGWVEKNRPTRLLLDNRQMRYIVSPEIQQWVTRHISPRTHSVKRVAVVISPDLFAEISTEQGLDEIQQVRPVQTRSFEDIEVAQKWLLEE